jgi:hypothetical protein
VHEMIDHVPATEQQRNANQNWNEERHNHSPFVVHAGYITLARRSKLRYFLDNCLMDQATFRTR